MKEYLAIGAISHDPGTYQATDNNRMYRFCLTNASLWTHGKDGQWQKAKALSNPLPCVVYDQDAEKVKNMDPGTQIRVFGASVKSDYIGPDHRRNVVWMFAISKIETIPNSLNDRRPG